MCFTPRFQSAFVSENSYNRDAMFSGMLMDHLTALLGLGVGTWVTYDSIQGLCYRHGTHGIQRGQQAPRRRTSYGRSPKEMW